MTARKHADYVYRDRHDSLRVRVHRRLNGRWDYDVFYPSGKITTYADEAGDDFATKRDAVAEANSQHGPLHAIAVEGNVVDAAWYRRASESSRSHSSLRKKTSSQLDREVAAALTGQPSETTLKRETKVLVRSHPRVITAYHGSDVQIRRFDPRYSAQGVFWFSTDKDKILRGESGAVSTKHLIKALLHVDKTAGWDEYDRHSLDELESLGYDSIHLDDDWVIFDPKRIKIVPGRS